MQLKMIRLKIVMCCAIVLSLAGCGGGSGGSSNGAENPLTWDTKNWDTTNWN